MASRCEGSRVWLGCLAVGVTALLTVAPSAVAATAPTRYTGAGSYTFTVAAVHPASFGSIPGLRR
jgi:hypothetical protein